MKYEILAPNRWILCVTFVTTLLACIGQMQRIPVVSEFGFAMAVVSYVALALACARRTRENGKHSGREAQVH